MDNGQLTTEEGEASVAARFCGIFVINYQSPTIN
jgi:hypothetical protein